MKNLSLILFLIFIACLVFSCTKKNDSAFEKIEIKTVKISKDSNFENIIELELELKETIQDILIKKGISRSELNLLVDKIKAESKNELDFKLKMNQTIDPSLYEKLNEFSVHYNKNWTLLNDRYIRISSNEILIACTKYYERTELKKINVAYKNSFSINNNIARACGWGYSLCLAGATAAAVICHTSCIGGTAGFGAPVCVFLCGTIQVAVGAECMKNYCEL